MTTDTTNTTDTTANRDSIASTLLKLGHSLDGITNEMVTKNTTAQSARADSTQYRNETFETNGRLPLMVKAAQISDQQGWELKDISEAMKRARAAHQGDRNSDDPSWRTANVFYSEVTTVIHPAVRRDFPAIVKLTTQAWNAEEQAIKATPENEKKPDTPCHELTDRVYRLILNISRRMRKNAGSKDNTGTNAPIVIKTTNDVVNYAREFNPRTYADAVQAKCKAMAKAFEDMAAEFHYERFTQIAGYLRNSELARDIVKARQDHDDDLKAEVIKSQQAQNNLRKPDGSPKLSGTTKRKPVVPASIQAIKAAVAAAKLDEPEIEEEDEEDGVTELEELLDNVA